MLGRECPEAVMPDRALYLPTFSDLLIVNKLLSLSDPLTRVSPYVRRPFPSKETRRLSDRGDPGPLTTPPRRAREWREALQTHKPRRRRGGRKARARLLPTGFRGLQP
jgi:hypothetical protein